METFPWAKFYLDLQNEKQISLHNYQPPTILYLIIPVV